MERWRNELLRGYAPNILPNTLAIARRWGVLGAQLKHGGADVLIAATAKEHGRIVSTRIVKHSSSTGIEVVDPYVNSR